jgi:hypothetical protein
MWREGFRSARPHLRSCRGLPPRSAQDGQELSGTPSPRRWGSLQVKPPPLCPRNGGKPTRHLLFFVSIRKLQYETALLMHLLRHHNMEVLSYKRFTPHCLKSLVLRTWGTGRSFGCLRRVGGTPRRNSECQAGCAPGGYLPHGVVEWRLRRRAGEVGTRGVLPGAEGNPWQQTPDLDVLQTGGWILPAFRPGGVLVGVLLGAGTTTGWRASLTS